MHECQVFLMTISGAAAVPIRKNPLNNNPTEEQPPGILTEEIASLRRRKTNGAMLRIKKGFGEMMQMMPYLNAKCSFQTLFKSTQSLWGTFMYFYRMKRNV